MDKEFQVSPLTGFLPETPPLERLPEYFEAWESLNDNLPELLKTKHLRQEVDKNLPLLLLSDRSLPTERHWNRAYKVLTFLSQGYLWQDGEEGAVCLLPKQLAVPWFEVSQRLGLPPVATYSAVLLWNWRLKDPKGPVTFENIQIETTYTGTKDEEWFYLISGAVDLAAVQGIQLAWRCLEEVKEGNTSEVIECLKGVRDSIQEMTMSLERMYESCEPDFFYSDIRKYQAGSKNLKAFSNGLIFEGVDSEPKGFVGASAAQSSTLPVMDILLGVEHMGTVKEFLDLQRWHMPRPHRQFLFTLSLRPSLKEFVLAKKSNEDLLNGYNECVQALGDFRNKHIIMVSRYIVTPASKMGGDKTEGGLATRGTGGSNFMVFLKSARDETLKCLIK